jgi:uncharacterized repeat protein (TIGR01451 family)
MKNYFCRIAKFGSLLLLPLLVLCAGCGSKDNPVASASGVSAAGATPGATVMTQPSGAQSQSLLGLLPGQSVNCIQTCSSATAGIGGTVTYTIQLAISGSAATGAQIQDVLPSGMSYVQGSATTLPGGTFTCTGSTLTWVYNTVGPCTCVMTYVAQVNNVVGLVGSTLANTAVMTCAGLSSAISTTVNLVVSSVPTLTPTVCMSTPTPTFTCVPPTATFTFTRIPTNTPTFTCVPPTNTPTYTFTNTYTPTNTFTFTPIPPTNTPTYTHTPTNTFTITNTPTNTFTFTNTFTPTNTFTATNTPTPLPTVSLSQTASSLTCALGGAVTYTINLAISGSAATNAQIQDVLPIGLSYVQGTATSIAGGTFTCTGSTLTWVYSTVGPCSCTMTYVAQVNNVLGLVGSTLGNTAVMTCPCMSSPLSSTTSLQVVGSLLGGLGL